MASLGINKGRVSALPRRLLLDNSHQLVRSGFSGFRVTVPSNGKDCIPDARHGDAIRRTVRLCAVAPLSWVARCNSRKIRSDGQLGHLILIRVVLLFLN